MEPRLPGILRTAERRIPLAHDYFLADLERLRAGEDMAELAAEFDDDRGGRARAGDLGWLFRHNPRTNVALEPLFLADPGELLSSVAIKSGWLLLKREL